MSAKPDAPLVVYVQLMNEGTRVYRPVAAVPIGVSTVRLVAVDAYDPDIETWEFPPGTIVHVESKQLSSGEVMVAVCEAPDTPVPSDA